MVLYGFVSNVSFLLSLFVLFQLLASWLLTQHIKKYEQNSIITLN